MTRGHSEQPLHRIPVALFVIVSLAFPGYVLSNPQGAAVRQGQVQIQRTQGDLRIHQQSQRAVIDWESFSIDRGETTRFLQPGANSAALNRVRGESASRIEGMLRANGQVYLINPNGILVGPSGTIDVGGFVASTLDTNDDDFMKGGNLRFSGASDAAVINLGSISALDGDVVLMAGSVLNEGSIRAPRGTAALAAGNDILLAESGEERVFVRGSGGTRKAAGVTNTGEIEANIAELKAHGGNIYGMAVRNEGRVAATGVTRQGGQIFLSAGGGKVRSTGTLRAKRSDGSGGKVKVDSGTGGSTAIGGTVDASGESGAGGEITILGNTIEVFDGTLILNDGETSGGITRIGGGAHGQDPRFSNAETLRVGNGAVISANALGSGDGGEIVLFATDTATINGTISARGGANGGNGGFIELSGRNRLFVPDLVGQVSLSAPLGNSGSLLLDPANINVTHGTGGGIMGTTMTDGALMDVLANFPVLIWTSDYGSIGDGDITFAANVNLFWSTPHSLTFQADRDMIFLGGAQILASGNGAFNATAARSISVGSGASIRTTNGNLTLSANQQVNATAGNFAGIDVNGGLVQSTGTGNVTVSGRGGTTGTTQKGVHVRGGGDIIGGTSGTVSVTGTGGTGSVNRIDGVNVEGSGATITSGGANVQVTGTGGASGVGFQNNIGVSALNGGVITAGGTGTVTVLGTGGSATGNGSHGVISEGAGSLITSNNGAVQITGIGTGDGASFINTGVSAYNGGTISAGGATSPLTVTGTSGTGAGGSHAGVFVGSSGAKFTSGGGAVQITGTAGTGGSNNFGIMTYDAAGSFTTATNGGNLTLIADSMSFSGAVSANSGSTVTLRQKTNGQLINLGAADSAGTLGLTDAELDHVTAGSLQIGNSNSGTITVSNAMTHANTLSLTTGAGMTVNNAITMAVDKNLTINASDTVSLANTNADLSATGSGIISVTTARNISLASSSSVTTVNGTLSLSANQQVIPTVGTFAGISINGGTVESSGTGVLSAIGRGGDTGNSNIGISVVNGGKIIGGTNGITLLTGTGGLSGGTSNIGVQVTGANSLLSTNGSNLSVFGYGGGTGAVSGSNSGVFVNTGGVITSGAGSGVSVEGTGGGGEGLNNKGVWVSQTGTAGTITSGGGFVSITGTGGGVLGSTNNQGVDQAGSSTVIGTGGGPLTITGTGGANTATEAIRLSGSVSTTGNQPITFIADSYSGSTVTINSGTGATTFLPLSNGFAIDLGGADVGGTTLGLTDAELDHITAGTVQIGNSNTGLITVSSGISHGNHLSLTTGAGVTINNAITMAVNRNLTTNTVDGINLATSFSDLSTSGTGTISLTSARNISLADNSSITTTLGNLTLSANASGTTSGLFEGVYVGNGASINSGTGTISITGRGGDTINAGNHGIRLDSTSTVGSAGGNIFLTGQARGSAGANPTQEGLIIRGNITTTGSGNITLSGTGGNATSGNIGVNFFDDVLVSTVNGNISITGTSGTGTNSPGIQIADFGGAPTVITSTGGTITLIGDGSAGSSEGILAFGSGTSIGGGTGNVELTATGDLSLTSNAQIGATGTGAVSLSSTRSISLGAGTGVTTVNGNLTLSANQQVVPDNGDFIGILVDGATIQSTGTGQVTVRGKGGNKILPFLNVDSQIGVAVRNGGKILGGTTGTLLVEGTGRQIASGRSNYNYGVQVRDSGSLISSNGAAVSVTGFGGNGFNENYGVIVQNDGQITSGGSGNVSVIGTAGDGDAYNNGISVFSGGVITSGGAGTVTVTGTAGSNAWDGSDAYGVLLSSSGSSITSGGGAVSVTGYGGIGGEESYGVLVMSGAIVSSGGGAVSVTGVARNITNSSGYQGGVFVINAGSTITSGGGNVTVSGTGATGGVESYGVILNSSGRITSGGIGTVSVTGTAGTASDYSEGVAVYSGGNITSSNGAVTVNGTGGTATGEFGYNDGIRVHGSGSTITSGGGNIVVTGTGGSGGAHENYGVIVNASGQIFASGFANLNVTGNAGGGDYYSSGVALWDGGKILAESGFTRVEGTGSTAIDLGSSSSGVLVDGTGSQIGATDGHLTIDGEGGTADGSSYGVLLNNLGIISATGSTPLFIYGDSGAGGAISYGIALDNGADILGGNSPVFVQGTSGSVTRSTGTGSGVALHAGSVINSTGGNVSVTGYGGIGGIPGSGGIANRGVTLFNNGLITAGGTGSVSVTGVGGNTALTGGNQSSAGVELLSYAMITSNSGAVTVNGTGGDANGTRGFSFGVSLSDIGATITSGGGDVSVTGTGGAVGLESYGVFLQASGLISAGGSGSVVVEGTGGSGLQYNEGISLYSNSSITSGGGAVTVIGQGGTGDPLTDNYGSAGIGVYNAGSQITSGGGDLFVYGFGGIGPTDNHGIWIGGGGQIIGSTGILYVSGTGGSDSTPSGLNHGILIEGLGSRISASGGDHRVAGIGGGDGSSNHGIRLQDRGEVVFSGPGLITLDGTAGGGNSFGISVSNATNGGAAIRSTGGGDIELVADSLEIASSTESIAAGSNLVTFRTKTIGHAIDIGGADSITSLGLSDDELDRVTAGTVRIGYIDTGTITVSDAITHGNHLSIAGGGAIDVLEAITMAADKDLSIETLDESDGTISLSRADADLSVSGTGRITVKTPRNLSLASGSSITSTAGMVGLTANLFGTTSGNFSGISLDGASVTTTTGNLFLYGIGGTVGNGRGIDLANDSLIGSTGGIIDLEGSTFSIDHSAITNTGTGTIDLDTDREFSLRNESLLSVVDGNLTINANAGIPRSGDFTAIAVESSELRTTGLGDIRMTGRGGDGFFSEPSGSTGIRLADGAVLSSSGTMAGAGSITLHGTGGEDGYIGNSGISMSGSTTSITSMNGTISLTGVGGASDDGGSIGILIYDNATIHSTGMTPDAATITLHGTGGGVGSYNTGVLLSDFSTGLHSAYGDILVTGIGGGDGLGINNHGIRLQNISFTIESTGMGPDAADITLHGTGGDGFWNNLGVSIVGEVTISTIDGAISITGLGGSGDDGNHRGIHASGDFDISSTGTGDLTLDGTGGGGGSFNEGVILQGMGSTISSVSGLVKIEGEGGGTVNGTDNRGIRVIHSTIQSTGAGGVELTGTGGFGNSRIDGIQLEDGATVRVANGAMVLEGTAGGTLGLGVIATDDNGPLAVTGTGSVMITGTGIGMNVEGVGLFNPTTNLGGSNAAFIRVDSLDGDLVLRSPATAAGYIGFSASGDNDVRIEGAVTSSGANIEFTGRNVTLSRDITATTGDIRVNVGEIIREVLEAPGGPQEITPNNPLAASGIATIQSNLVAGGDLFFTGGDGDADTVTYAGYTGAPINFHFADLDSIEILTGPAAGGDELIGANLPSLFEFTGADAFTLAGVTVTGFENVTGGDDDDVFAFPSGTSLSGHLNGGGGTANQLDYSLYDTGVIVDLGGGAATAIGNGIENIQVFAGTGNIDTITGPGSASTYYVTGPDALTVGNVTVTGFENLTGGNGADTFRIGPLGSITGRLSGGSGAAIDTLNYAAFGRAITANIGPNTATALGGGFTDIEAIVGSSGNDRFNFLNQATISFVDGGPGTDLLELNDSDLPGDHTYTITRNSISRNPFYAFQNMDAVRLFLGPGNNTVDSGFFPYTQFIHGGSGFNTLNLPGVASLNQGNPIRNVYHYGIDGPRPDGGDVGGLLQLEINQRNAGNPGTQEAFTTENQFSIVDPATLSQQIGNLSGAFSAAVLGQAVIVSVEGNSYLVLRPFSLDGSGLTPSNLALNALAENLGVDANLELAAAIGYSGPIFLINPDGPNALDLSGVPADPAIRTILQESLAIAAAAELSAALGLTLTVSITGADGIVPTALDGSVPGQGVTILLTGQLDAAAFAELNAAIGGN